jgi:hypothetical protein
MYEIVKEFPNEIIFQEGEPCISLYQLTHRHSPKNQKDLIVFNNSIREIEDSLKQKYKKADINLIMKPFYKLKDDRDFWNKTLDGLAILANQNRCIVYRLARPVQNLAMVADGFHIKPLIRAFQSANNYHLLCLSGSEFSLYEANRYGIEEVEMGAEISRTINGVLGDEHTESFLTHGSYGGTDGNAIFHGQGGKKDEADKDLVKFFRYVDRVILENFSKAAKLPLILVSLAEHHGVFKKISNNPYLMEDGIKVSYDSLKMAQLNEKVWDIMEPINLEKTQKLVDSFKNAKANFLGSDDLVQVGRAAFEKKVKTILIEADKIIPGKFDGSTGRLEFENIDNPDYGDVLDNIVKSILRDKGEVVVLPRERMPSDTGLAAIYRF